jgi:hypothetical protein
MFYSNSRLLTYITRLLKLVVETANLKMAKKRNALLARGEHDCGLAGLININFAKKDVIAVGFVDLRDAIIE